MILCCGEALIDMLPRQSAEGEDAFAPHAGGAVFNTVVALGRLGSEPGFFCGLSRDLFGARLERGLQAAGVDTQLCPRSDQPTTLAFVSLVNGQATYAFYDENTAMRVMTQRDLPVVPEHVEALFFGGISLVSEPCGDAFEALALREAANKTIILDPNIRPGFIQDEVAYRSRLERMIAAADIVKLSDEDLEWLLPGGQPQDILARGAKCVLITEGAKGARAVTTTQDRFAPANTVEVIDTVGAGDTFNAGVLASLQTQGALSKPVVQDLSAEVLDAALRTGVAAAAITVSRAGANPPWRSEMPS